MSNIIQFPKIPKTPAQNNENAKILPFKKKDVVVQDEKGIMIDASKLKQVFSLEEFFNDDEDVLFMG